MKTTSQCREKQTQIKIWSCVKGECLVMKLRQRRERKERCDYNYGNPLRTARGVCACLCWLGCLRDGPGGANTPNQPSQRSYCSPLTIHSLTWLSKAKDSLPQRRFREKQQQQHCNCLSEKQHVEIKFDVSQVLVNIQADFCSVLYNFFQKHICLKAFPQ